jgi:GT2 family glycosyltransferase
MTHGMPPVTIVSLGKYPEIFQGLHENLERFTAPVFNKVLVRDGLLIEEAPGWKLVDGPDDFNFSANVSLGLEHSDPEHDVFFISDDVRLKTGHTIEKLRELAYANEEIGMLAPRVIGPADNPLQTNPNSTASLVYSSRYLVFVCLYIKRVAIQRVGYLDKETFGGYGWDDVDYSRRVHQSGLRLAVTPAVEVIHGVTRKGTETFFKTEKGRWDRLEKQNQHNELAYVKKWGDNKKENW